MHYACPSASQSQQTALYRRRRRHYCHLPVPVCPIQSLYVVPCRYMSYPAVLCPLCSLSYPAVICRTLCSLPYRVVLRCTLSFSTISCRPCLPYPVVLCRTVPFSAVPCRSLPYRAVLCRTLPFSSGVACTSWHRNRSRRGPCSPAITPCSAGSPVDLQTARTPAPGRLIGHVSRVAGGGVVAGGGGGTVGGGEGREWERNPCGEGPGLHV